MSTGSATHHEQAPETATTDDVISLGWIRAATGVRNVRRALTWSAASTATAAGIVGRSANASLLNSTTNGSGRIFSDIRTTHGCNTAPLNIVR